MSWIILLNINNDLKNPKNLYMLYQKYLQQDLSVFNLKFYLLLIKTGSVESMISSSSSGERPKY